MKEFNLGDVVRLKFHPNAIAAKYDGREGVIVAKINCGGEYGYEVNVIGAEINRYKPFTKEIIGQTSVLSGIFEDGLELVNE